MSAPTKPESPAESLETIAARARETGPIHDLATLQILREMLSAKLTRGGGPREAKTILPLIIAARRQLLAEQKANGKPQVIGPIKPAVLDQVIDAELRLPPEERDAPPPRAQTN